MKTKDYKTLSVLAAALLAMSVTLPVAHADNDGDESFGSWFSERHSNAQNSEPRRKTKQPVQANATFQKECSDCHIAYPARFLPAESWRRMMAGLDDHFGSNASLDALDNKEITDYLVANASTKRRYADNPSLRITEAKWFKREHGAGEISPSVWNNPKVKSPSNCGACHTKSDQGNFSERNIRVPKLSYNKKSAGLI